MGTTQMGRKTYIPGLKAAFKVLRRFIANNRDGYKNNISIFLFALADLVLDLVDIFLGVLEITSDISGHYDPDIPVNDAPYINQCQAAFDKFLTTVTTG